MAIDALCKNNVIQAEENTNIADIAKLMQDNNVGSVIITQNKNPVGIITDRDIAVKVVAAKKDANNTKASEIMAKNILTLQCNQGIKEAIDAMSQKGVRRAPVMKDNEICGIAAVDDLVSLIAKEMNSLANLVQKQISH